MEVKRHEANPEHGRPCILTLTGEPGQLAVHVDREDRSLWLFATGPRGGDRGRWVCPVTRAGAMALWTQDPGVGFYGAEHHLRIRDGELWLFRSVHDQRTWFRMQLTPEAREMLLLCLREWAHVAQGAPA